MEKSSIGVVARDLLGNPYNSKYPPMPEKFGSNYCGYQNWNREVFFYEFAVQGYDVTFVYNGNKYFLMADAEYFCTCDDMRFTPSESSLFFANGNELIEQLEIEGQKLINIIDTLEEVEIW